MIQRLQTLFLFIVLVCSIMYFIFPIAHIILPDNTIPIKICGFYCLDEKTLNNNFISGWYLMTLAIINSLTTLISIFLYKKRMLQIRLNIFNIFIKLGFFTMIFFFLHQSKIIDYHISILIILPIVEVILTILAIRLILRDEVLVKSIDRIR